MAKGSQCKKCGRVYSRSYCEYCSREDRWWKNHFHKTAQRLFPPRILRDLQDCAPQPANGDVQAIRQGTGLFLHGGVGMGKTVYAAAVTMDSLRLEMVEQTKNVRANRVAFLTAAQLLRSIRETYNGPQETEVGPVNFTESDVIDRYAHSDLLVLDDLTYINVTPWAVDILDDLINTRYEYLRPTIMTSNVADLDELAQVFDSPRIPSRVIESCRVYDFGADTDYRAEAADG